nr:hypothetical protein [Halorhabdus amylolytica]
MNQLYRIEVLENVNELADYGLVELQGDGRAKRPVVWYDEIDVDLPLTTSSNGGRKATPEPARETIADNVDPEDPRPSGHYHVDRDAEWFFVDDDLAETIALGPATDGEPGDDWVLTLSATTSEEDPAPAERVAVRLTPWALHELHIEAKTSRRTPVRRVTAPSVGSAGSRPHSTRCGRTTGKSPVTRTATPRRSVRLRGAMEINQHQQRERASVG